MMVMSMTITLMTIMNIMMTIIMIVSTMRIDVLRTDRCTCEVHVVDWDFAESGVNGIPKTMSLQSKLCAEAVWFSPFCGVSGDFLGEAGNLRAATARDSSPS